MKLPNQKLSVVIALLLCAGCASTPAERTNAQKTIVHKPAPVNLAGFPVVYKEGYSDACAGAKNAKRYKADAQYNQGWQDGSFTCKKK